jgi:cyclopropane fatty-acyl-phospholipid synthase-like methyltransferase
MLTKKDGLELNFWTMAADIPYHRAKLSVYLWSWGCYKIPDSVLEIGCGPIGGFLPLITRARRRVGVDPLVDEYRKAGLLPADPGIDFVAAHFEQWETIERFDAIVAADSLDHGEMGFDLIPKIAELLNPGGRFYLHVHLRPPERLNESHDHSLTSEGLDRALAAAVPLIELRREIFPIDVDGTFECPALVAVWERAQ